MKTPALIIGAALLATGALAGPVRDVADLRAGVDGVASLTDAGQGRAAGGVFASRGYVRSVIGHNTAESYGGADVRSLRFGRITGLADAAYTGFARRMTRR